MQLKWILTLLSYTFSLQTLATLPLFSAEKCILIWPWRKTGKKWEWEKRKKKKRQTFLLDEYRHQRSCFRWKQHYFSLVILISGFVAPQYILCFLSSLLFWLLCKKQNEYVCDSIWANKLYFDCLCALLFCSYSLPSSSPRTFRLE